MLIVTTLDYNQFGTFIRDKQVSLNNAGLILGQDFEPVTRYLKDRFGTDGYVMGIRGRINEQSVALLSQLDSGLAGDRIVVEVDADDDEVLTLNVDGLEEAVQMMTYGLPDEMVYDQLDSSIMQGEDTKGVQVVCTPSLDRTRNIRITTLNREVALDVEGITFVRLKGGRS